MAAAAGAASLWENGGGGGGCQPPQPPVGDDQPAEDGQDKEKEKILEGLQALLWSQQRMESELSLLVADQRAIAASLGVERQEQPFGRQSVAGEPAAVLPSRSDFCLPFRRDQSKHTTCSFSGILCESEPACTKAPQSMEPELEREQEGAVTDHVLSPAEARVFFEAHPYTLFLDVSDGREPAAAGAHCLSLERLAALYGALDTPETGGAWESEESGQPGKVRICKRPSLVRTPAAEEEALLFRHSKEDPVVVTCSWGGLQARKAARLLLDQGFSTVKALEGGNSAWRAECTGLPMHWPMCLERRECFLDAGVQDTRSVSDPPWRNRKSPPAKRGSSSLSLLIMPEASSVARLLSAQTTKRRFAWSCRKLWKRSRTFIIAPSSGLRICLDILSIVILVFDMVTVPWYLAWDVQGGGWLDGLSTSIVAFWTLDILVTFRTGFFHQGQLYMDPGVIARRYLRSWFLPDLCVVSLDWASQVLLVMDSSAVEVPALRVLRFAKWSRLLRFVRMVRFIRFSDLFERVLDFGYYSPRILLGFQIVRILFIIFFLNHLGACIWWWIGRAGHSNTALRWVDLPAFDAEHSFIEADIDFQYTTALHCAMTQILAGSMQVRATNSFEQAFSVVFLISGVLFLSHLVSTLAARTTQLRMLQQDRSSKVAQLREFLHRKAIGAELGVHIIKQVDESLKERRPDVMAQLSAWEALSEKSRTKLHRELTRPHLVRCPLFLHVAHMDHELLRMICDEVLQVVMYYQEDTVFANGTPAPETFMVISGNLRYLQDAETCSGGEALEASVSRQQWLCEASLWCKWTHVGSLETASASAEMLVLKSESLGEVLARSGTAWQLVREYSRAFHARLQSARPPFSDWPNDLSVPCASFEEVVASMGKQVRCSLGLLALQSKLPHLRSASWVQRIRQQLYEGTCTVVMTLGGDAEMLVSCVALHLEDHGKVLAQLGTWDGHAAKPACRLPGTALQSGEMPKAALHRLLYSHLSPLADAVGVRRATTQVECWTDSHLRVRTTTTKHFGQVDSPKWPEHLPTACSVTRGSNSLSIGSSLKWRPTNTGGGGIDRVASVSVEDVYVIAGSPDDDADKAEEAAAPALRLLAWLEPAVLERLQHHPGELRSLLAGIVVTQESALEARRLFEACECARQTSTRSPVTCSPSRWRLCGTGSALTLGSSGPEGREVGAQATTGRLSASSQVHEARDGAPDCEWGETSSLHTVPARGPRAAAREAVLSQASL